jgi:putative ABC transport system substrate-binding protein
MLQLGVSAAGLALATVGCAPSMPWDRPRIPRIAWGSYGPREGAITELYITPFLEGLRQNGYVEGETIAIDWRFAADQSNAELAHVARELVDLSPDVLVVGLGTGILLEAQRETSTIPIVGPLISPVQRGLVASLARPGGNITGPSVDTPGGFSKHLDLLREVVPGLRDIVFLVDGRATAAQGADADWELFRTAAEALDLHADRVNLLSANDVEVAFETPEMHRAHAFYSDANGFFFDAPRKLAEPSLRHRLPSITNNRHDFAEAGFLMTYGPSQSVAYRRLAVYVDRILKGARPGDLPVEQPTSFELFVNVQTLQTLGLSIPPSLQPLVTEWVQ